MHNAQTITEYSGRLSASNIRRFAEDATEQVTRTRHVKLNVSLDPTEAGLIVERSSAGLSISLEGQPDWKLIIEGDYSDVSTPILVETFFLKWRRREQPNGAWVYVLANDNSFQFDERKMQLRRVGI